MNQLFTHFSIFCAALFFLFPSCTFDSPCRELTGRWTTREGQDIVFQAGGTALWLTSFGSQFDTVRLHFLLNCKKAPAAIDLSDFENGPHKGQTLYGILEWQSDSSFRLRYEPGARPEARPKAFEPEQTLKFFRKE